MTDMKKNEGKKEQKKQNINSDEKGLEALSKTVGGLVRKDKYGAYGIDPAKAASKESALALLACAKILKGLAKIKKFACVNNGTLFYDSGFDFEASEAVFNARLIADGRKEVLK